MTASSNWKELNGNLYSPTDKEVKARAHVGAVSTEYFGLSPIAGGESEAQLDAKATANDTALANAIASVQSTGERLVLAPGTFPVSETVRFTEQKGLRVSGCGPDERTTLRWRGNTSDTMLELKDCRESLVSELQLDAVDSHPLARGVYFRWAGDGSFVSLENQLRDVVIQGNGGYVGNGVTVGKDELADDFNNSEHTFENLRILGYGSGGGIFSDSCAFRNEQSQAKAIEFSRCRFRGGTGAQYGYYGHTAFEWHGTGGGANEIADFYFTTFNDTCLIDGWNSENSQAFIHTASKQVYTGIINVHNVRWTGGDMTGANLNRVINYQWGGTFNVTSSTFRRSEDDIEFRFDGSSPVAVGFRHNLMRCESIDPDVFMSFGTGDYALYLEGNTSRSGVDENDRAAIPDRIVRPVGSTETILT